MEEFYLRQVLIKENLSYMSLPVKEEDPGDSRARHPEVILGVRTCLAQLLGVQSQGPVGEGRSPVTREAGTGGWDPKPGALA